MYIYIYVYIVTDTTNFFGVLNKSRADFFWRFLPQYQISLRSLPLR